jgi:hypothetical protein
MVSLQRMRTTGTEQHEEGCSPPGVFAEGFCAVAGETPGVFIIQHLLFFQVLQWLFTIYPAVTADV